MDLTFFRNKKVLITGGTGFIGRNFVETLLHASADIRITLHNRPSPFRPDLVQGIHADLTKVEDCARACAGIDYVIHAAGSVGNAGTIRSNLLAPIVENLVLSGRLLEAAAVHCDRMLIFSSGTAAYPPSHRPVREEDMWQAPPAPVYFGYGWMRRYLELLGEYASSVSPLQVMVCRPTAVYGRYDRSGHVIPSLIRRALAGDNPLVVWGSGEEQRDFLHVSDMVRGCLLLLQKGVACDPVNIGSGRTASIAEVTRIITSFVGPDEPEIVFDNAKPTTIPFRAVDCSKAEKTLGFVPEVSLEAGVRDAVEWVKTTQARGDA